jgi:FkbM family methyltransferase
MSPPQSSAFRDTHELIRARSNRHPGIVGDPESVSMFTAALKQDAVVYGFLHNKSHGFFVDVGAMHEANGSGSNTYALEKDYGWKGLLIEPHPDRAEELRKVRGVPVCAVAIFDRDGGFLELESSTMGGVTECEADSLWRAWMKLGAISVPWKPKFATVTVPARSLTSLLMEHQAPRVIDYLSVDTEGSEYQILSAIDYSAHQYNVINYEHNFVSALREKTARLLEGKGYRFAGGVGCDDFFVHESLDGEHCAGVISRINAERIASDPSHEAMFRAYELYDTLPSAAVRHQFALRTASLFLGRTGGVRPVTVHEVEALRGSIPSKSTTRIHLANGAYWLELLAVAARHAARRLLGNDGRTRRPFL